jgi:hypothetical protein
MNFSGATPSLSAAGFGCEIHAGATALADLTAIVRFCAGELGLAIEIVPRASGEPATIVLQLSADQAAAQHPVWCLACRLACFCPDARVSVLVQAQPLFASASNRPGRRVAS